MSYVKIDEEELKSIKSSLDTAIQSLDNNFNIINNNIPVRRNLEDPDMLAINNKEGTNYAEIGKKYNDAIGSIEKNMENNDIVTRLTNISNKIQTIISAIEDFNNVSYLEIEKIIKETSAELTYLDEFSDIEKTELLAIKDYSSGEKPVDPEDTEEGETPSETNPEGGTANETKEDDTPEEPKIKNGEGGTGNKPDAETPTPTVPQDREFEEATITNTKEETTPTEPTYENGENGSANENTTPTPPSSKTSSNEGGYGKTNPNEESDDEENSENEDYNKTNKQEDDNPSRESINNNESGSRTNSKDEEEKNGGETNSEGGKSNTKEEDDEKEDEKNGESGNIEDPSLTDPTDPVLGLSEDDDPFTNEDEDSSQDSDNNNESGAREDNRDDEPVTGLEGIGNESGSTLTATEQPQDEMNSNEEEGTANINNDSIISGIVTNGIIASTALTLDNEDDVEIIDGSQDEGIKHVDPDANYTDFANSQNSDNQNIRKDHGKNNKIANGISGYTNTNDSEIEGSEINGLASTWAGYDPTDLDTDSENNNPNGKSGGTGNDKDSDFTGNMSKIAQGIAKGENTDTTENSNSEYTKKSSSTFVGALLTVLGGIFGLGKKNNIAKDGTLNNSSKKTPKGFFENVRNFFKDIFGLNKDGFKGKDNTQIDTSEKDELSNAGKDGKGKNGKNNKAFDFFTADYSNNRDKNRSDLSKYGKDGNGSSKNKGLFNIDKDNDFFSRMKLYRSIIRTLTIVGIPGLIVLAIAKIISYLWLIILLLLLILLIATFYTMFKEEKAEKDEEVKTEKEDLEK